MLAAKYQLMAITAYDYQKQRWIEGEAARELLRTQPSDEIALLRGSQGNAYAKMIGAHKQELLRLRERVNSNPWERPPRNLVDLWSRLVLQSL